ncbi:bifunctional nuclease family protein [Corynebacterium alimapuense]|uniref:Bifunctional nuclease family protein n=1 Tax=Corynebacterium alimapuense TaxID=1576874 RepID=A0A3M8K7C3_9CORY|nr:bifunctional nuclease family protein [Corynebacterium alimapuense]RNE49113.1 bifunctional nuclease family protein [Corynebacterium alimapuense]
MTFIPVEYHGVYTTGPEQFTCVLLRWTAQNRILPIWISPILAADLEARDEGFSPRRPGTPDLMLEMITRLTSGVAAINIVSHFEGVFIASVVFNDGEEIDARPSDAITLARALQIGIQVDEDVLTQASFFASDAILEEYFGISIESEDAEELLTPSASGDAAADADFEQMMRSLGMSESDFLDGQGDGFDAENSPEEKDTGSPDT